MSQLNLIPLRKSAFMPEAAIRAKNAWISAPWRINAGQTLSLRLREPVRLRVSEGRLWVTQDGVSGGLTPGDHFVGRGQDVTLAAGRVVVECCGRSAAHWRFEALPVLADAGREGASLDFGREAGFAAFGLTGLGGFAADFFAGLLLAARKAASKAMPAQSRIKAADSMASGGAT
ncbi:MAG: hypothetical protein RLZZ271_77 [Pseudomonadota bacterium]|jgi:hypothetical protein